jgi:uncharacterized protein YbaA (DUF1428 family)
MCALCESDRRLAGVDAKAMPFDAMHMFWGGFEVFLEA